MKQASECCSSPHRTYILVAYNAHRDTNQDGLDISSAQVYRNQPREQKEAWIYTIGMDGDLKGCTHYTHSSYSLHGGRFAWGLFSSSDLI